MVIKYFTSHINNFNRRQGVVIISVIHFKQLVISKCFCMIKTIDRRGSGSQNQRSSVCRSSVFSNLPCMVSRIDFRFIAVFMFLIKNYHSDIFKRSKYCASSADNNVYFIIFYFVPLVKSFSIR